MPVRCRADIAHTGQSRPNSVLGFQVEVLTALELFRSLFARQLQEGPRQRIRCRASGGNPKCFADLNLKNGSS